MKIEKYYSGLVSLNLYKSIYSGDWHSRIAFNFLQNGETKSKTAIIDKSSDFNPFDFFEDEGIVEYSKEISAFSLKNFHGITYVATHVRAAADMLLYQVLNLKDCRIVDFNGWFLDPKDIKEVFNMLEKNLDKFNENQKTHLLDFKKTIIKGS